MGSIRENASLCSKTQSRWEKPAGLQHKPSFSENPEKRKGGASPRYFVKSSTALRPSHSASCQPFRFFQYYDCVDAQPSLLTSNEQQICCSNRQPTRGTWRDEKNIAESKLFVKLLSCENHVKPFQCKGDSELFTILDELLTFKSILSGLTLSTSVVAVSTSPIPSLAPRRVWETPSSGPSKHPPPLGR